MRSFVRVCVLVAGGIINFPFISLDFHSLHLSQPLVDIGKKLFITSVLFNVFTFQIFCFVMSSVCKLQSRCPSPVLRQLSLEFTCSDLIFIMNRLFQHFFVSPRMIHWLLQRFEHSVSLFSAKFSHLTAKHWTYRRKQIWFHSSKVRSLHWSSH